MDKITLLLIDDHTLLVDAWSSLLGSDHRFAVVGETGNADEAYEIVRRCHPKVVLTDINMSPVDGFQVTQAIRSISGDCRVIGVSLHTMPAYAKKMLQLGAMGYVTKNSSIEELKKAILEVSLGHKYICSEIKDKLVMERFSDDDKQHGIKMLSKRELQVIQFIKTGLSSKQIGCELDITVKTVEVHRYNILKKLCVRNTAALINLVNSVGL